MIIYFFLAFLFFLLVPFLGALFQTATWRLYRKQFLISLITKPLALDDYTRSTIKPEKRLFIGLLEGLDDEGSLWVKSQTLPSRINVADSPILILSGMHSSEDAMRIPMGETSLQVCSWKNLGTINEGMHIMVCGMCHPDAGLMVFESHEKRPLFILLFDGEIDVLFYRFIWAARSPNPYWNRFTPVSIAFGSALLLGLSLVYGPGMDPLQGGILFALGIMPLLPVLPPGIGGWFLYRWFWGQAVEYAAEASVCGRLLQLIKTPAEITHPIQKAGSVPRWRSALQQQGGDLVDYRYCFVPKNEKQLLGARLFHDHPRTIAQRCKNLSLLAYSAGLVAIVAGICVNGWLVATLISKLQ